MPQIYDMGPTVLLPLRRKACWRYFRPKNPTASAGFQPANLGTKGQHATPRPLKPLIVNNRLNNTPNNKDAGTSLTDYPHSAAFFLRSWQVLSYSKKKKKSPAFYETPSFISSFKTARHVYVSWARSIQSTRLHPTSWTSILILFLPNYTN